MPSVFDRLTALRQKAEPHLKPVEVTKSLEGKITEIDEDKRHVFGWAYVAIRKDGTVVDDHSGDFVDDVEEVEKMAYPFVLNSRQGDVDHTNVHAADLIESVVFTPEKIEKMGLPPGSVPLAWWVGFKINDDAAWERVKKRELRSFSIHGKGLRTPVQ